MTICYFGDYDPAYNRTKVILRGFRAMKIQVIECREAGTRGFALYRALWRKHRACRGKYDLLFVGYGNARLLPVFARFITRTPVIWDALYSLYDNWIFDRKLAQPHGAKAYWYWLVDWLGCFASTLVILDTRANIKYFEHTFGFPARKFARVLVGADTETFRPCERSAAEGPFEVEFHGKYIPVQGTDVLVRAAKLLENDDVHITMIGGGQDCAKTKNLAAELDVRNVTFLPTLPLAEIPGYVRRADASIGLLGDVPRVARAIPNKLYEAAAMARVAVNADTPAVREVFTPGASVVVVRAGNPEDVASALRALKTSGKAAAMGQVAYEEFIRHCGSGAIVAQLTEALRRIRVYL